MAKKAFVQWWDQEVRATVQTKSKVKLEEERKAAEAEKLHQYKLMRQKVEFQVAKAAAGGVDLDAYLEETRMTDQKRALVNKVNAGTDVRYNPFADLKVK
jgi:hypothetical protein